jgi:polyprenyl P-hydroxybenzoate/phenylacrylic acid decarboxylase-like protein
MSDEAPIILAITGASGAPYARKILLGLAEAHRRVHLIISPAGRRLLHDELGVEQPDPESILGASLPHDISVLPYNDVGACIASGSYRHAGMVVAPCSSSRLAQIAHGLGDNLISRAAQVTLKERRPLILLHREMPVSLIELRNMVQVTEAGGIVCPASPGFYLRPQSIDDLVAMTAGRVLDLLGVEHSWNIRWRGAGA